MLTAIDEMIYGRALVGLAVASVLFQLVVLVMAARRRGRQPLSLKLHAIAGAAVIALPLTAGLSVRTARKLMMHAFDGPGEPLGRSVAILTSLASQLDVIPFAVSTTALALVSWFAGLAFTISTPRQDGSSRSLPPAALVAVGLLPIAYGALRWATSLIATFAAFGDMPSDQRVVITSRALAAARAQLERDARLSMIAIPILAAVAIVLVVLHDRNRERVDGGVPPRAPAARRTLAAIVASVVLAALLLVAARPMAGETNMSWPPPVVGVRLPSADPPTPDLVGPDRVEWAPVVLVYRNELGLDGAPVEDLASLQDKLDLLRVNYVLLHPGAFFNEMAVIVADRTTPIPRLLDVLRAVRGAEYHQPLFTFTKAEVVVRPMLGRLQRVSATGAGVRLAYTGGKDEDEYEDDEEAAAWRDALALRPQDFAAYEAFARRLVELRGAGKRVIVTVDRPRR